MGGGDSPAWRTPAVSLLRLSLFLNMLPDGKAARSSFFEPLLLRLMPSSDLGVIRGLVLSSERKPMVDEYVNGSQVGAGIMRCCCRRDQRGTVRKR